MNGRNQAGTMKELKIFQECGFRDQLVDRELVLANNGYREYRCALHIQGQAIQLSTCLRSRNETLKGRMKVFNILHHMFRHIRDQQAISFHTVPNNIQVEIGNGYPLFSI